jgi:hypothetical protein
MVSVPLRYPLGHVSLLDPDQPGLRTESSHGMTPGPLRYFCRLGRYPIDVQHDRPANTLAPQIPALDSVVPALRSEIVNNDLFPDLKLIYLLLPQN